MMTNLWRVDAFMRFLPVGDTRARFGFRASMRTPEVFESRGPIGDFFFGAPKKG
jgi:hypothetical protein